MNKLSEVYLTNHNALTESTKGQATGNQIMWCAVAMTIFEIMREWVEKKA